MRIDLHTHSLISDGTDTPAEVVAQAREAGLDVIALCDHDTFDGLDEALTAGREQGVVVVPGVELSCEKNGVSIHLLGYGCRTDDPSLYASMVKVRDSRHQRIPRMAAKLTALGLTITAAEIEAQAQGSSVGRPHVADALVAKGYVADRREAFDRYIYDGGPGYEARYEIPLEQGIEQIHGAGGVAIIAHPWGRASRDVLPLEYLEHLVIDCGLDGIEVNHTDHDESVRAELGAWADQHALICTGSSDFHGAGKPENPLGINLTDPEMYARLLDLMEARSQ